MYFIQNSEFKIQNSLKFRIQNSTLFKVKDNIIRKKSFQFALSIITLYRDLATKKEFIISKQLLRSGTSIGANIEEATAAQTKKDFISKMAIANKEARETKYWLNLLQMSQIVDQNFNEYLTSIEEIIKILTSIIKSSQESQN